MVPKMGSFSKLLEVNKGVAPEPLAPKPIAVLSFVHAYVVFVPGLLAKLIGLTDALLQNVLSVMVVITGFGFTVICTDVELIKQVPLLTKRRK